MNWENSFSSYENCFSSVHWTWSLSLKQVFWTMRTNFAIKNWNWPEVHFISKMSLILSNYKLRELKKSAITRNNLKESRSSLMKCFVYTYLIWLLAFNFTKQNSTYFSACSLRRFSKNWAMLSFGLSFSAPVHAKVWSVSITEDPVRLCRCWLFESSWKP